MGTDIYRYVILSIEGKEVVIEFYSGQSVGLAEMSAAFWVDMLCSADGAFSNRLPNCALTSHQLFRMPSGEVRIQGGEMMKSMEDVKTLLERVNAEIGTNLEIEKHKSPAEDDTINNDARRTGSDPLTFGAYGFYGDGSEGTGMIHFNTVVEAKTFIDHVNKGEDGSTAYFRTVKDGPEWISQYDGYPEGTFEHFVERVELLEVFYEDIEDDDGWKRAGVEENYWNTKAKYKLTMTAAEYLEHIKESETWDGR